MKRPLLTDSASPNTKSILLLILMLLCLGPVNSIGQAITDVDLLVADLTVTAVDQTSFIYSFDVTNSGSTPVNGYSMRLTFSKDQFLSTSDYFSLTIPTSDLGGQYVGPTQTLLKNEHFNASLPAEYLPSGTWYVFAEINPAHIVEEVRYDNNVAQSSNTITVAPYQINFTVLPTVDAITDSTFTIEGTLDSRVTKFFYRYQPAGTLAPTESEMLNSSELYPWQSQVTISSLGPAFSFDVYCMGRSYDGNTTAIQKIPVTTTGSAIPTIVFNKYSIALQPAPINQASLDAVFLVSAYYLASDLIITPDENFLVSKDGVAYANQISFVVADFAASSSQTVFVKSVPIKTAGMTAGLVSSTSAGAKVKNVEVGVSVFDPKSSNFDGLTSLEQSGWKSYNVLGSELWSFVDLDKTSVDQRGQGQHMALLMDGSNTAGASNEDWLISPPVDLSTFQYYPNLHFRTYSSGEGLPLTLVYSTDFTGFGDPHGATWYDVDAQFAAVNSKEWTISNDQLLNNQNTVFFAFVYLSTGESASRWTIDDWRITDNLTSIPEATLVYEGIEVGTVSNSQSIQVEFAGYGDVKVTASEGFKVSLDNQLFTQDLTISEAEAMEGKTIYVVFAPTSLVNALAGSLSFSGNDLSVSRSTMVGSSMITTAIERYARNSGFIFPNPTDGVVHVDLKKFDDQGGSMPVTVTNSVGAKVAAFDSSTSSLDSKLSDVLTSLAPGIYFVTLNTIGVVYRNKVIRK